MARNEQSDSAYLDGMLASSSYRNLSYDYAGGPAHPAHAPNSIEDLAAGGPNTLYHWDTNGNQTSSDIAGLPGSRQMEWDHEDRVARFTQHSGTAVPDVTTNFIYDAGGTRTHKVNPDEGSLTLYPNQFTSVRRSYAAGGSAPFYARMTNHVYAGEQRIASSVIKSSSGTRQTYWYHGDHLTSNNWVTNADGAVTEHLEYYPYGEQWIEEAGTGSTGPGTPEGYRYTAKELDSETGLYYFGARYYDPRIALWASADPILASYLSGGPNGGVWRPLNLGLFSYSYNSPIRLRDPDGLAGGEAEEEAEAEVEQWGNATFETVRHPVGTQVQWEAYYRTRGGVYNSSQGRFVPGLIYESPPPTRAQIAAAGAAHPPPGANYSDAVRGAVVAPSPAPPAPVAVPASTPASTIAANNARGAAFEAETAAQAQETQSGVVRELTLRTASGVRTRMDVAGRSRDTGEVVLTEAKSSATARLTPNQTVAHPEIARSGATVVGRGRPGFPGGTVIPPTPVTVVRPPSSSGTR